MDFTRKALTQSPNLFGSCFFGVLTVKKWTINAERNITSTTYWSY